MSEYFNVNFYVMHMTTTRGQQTTLTLNSIGLEKKKNNFSCILKQQQQRQQQTQLQSASQLG